MKHLQHQLFVQQELLVYVNKVIASHVLQVIFANKEFHSHQNAKVDPTVQVHLALVKHVKQATIVLRDQFHKLYARAARIAQVDKASARLVQKVTFVRKALLLR